MVRASEDQLSTGSEGRGFESVGAPSGGSHRHSPNRCMSTAVGTGDNAGLHLLSDARLLACGIDDSGSSGRSMLDPAADVGTAVFDNLLSVSDLKNCDDFAGMDCAPDSASWRCLKR